MYGIKAIPDHKKEVNINKNSVVKLNQTNLGRVKNIKNDKVRDKISDNSSEDLFDDSKNKINLLGKKRLKENKQVFDNKEEKFLQVIEVDKEFTNMIEEKEQKEKKRDEKIAKKYKEDENQNLFDQSKLLTQVKPKIEFNIKSTLKYNTNDKKLTDESENELVYVLK